MNYNLYLFSKLADELCPDVQNVYEIDLKFDVVSALYKEYDSSPYPGKLKLSDHDAMVLWFQDRNDINEMKRLREEVNQLKWRLKCIQTDAVGLERIALNQDPIEYDRETIGIHKLNIDIACDTHSTECLMWMVNGREYEPTKK